MRIPITIANCAVATNLPLNFAGAISEIYIGDNTEAPPTARPPMNRNITKIDNEFANPVPIAEMKNSAAITLSMVLLPKTSPGFPIESAPITQPISAELTA